MCNVERQSARRYTSAHSGIQGIICRSMSITFENISKSVNGKTVLNDVSMQIEDGAFIALLGQTGAGKTSLLRILAGIDKPDTGRIFFDGEDVTRLSVQQRKIAFVYQQFINYPSLTVYENIASPLRVVRPRLGASEIDKRVSETAELLGLTHILQHRPEEISGGQQQRTAIARALVKGAKHIFLDEPLANLDYKLREELRGELKRIFRDRGGAVVYATPEPIDALSMATHVGMMHEGTLLQYGRAREVYENPLSEEVGAFFSFPSMNILYCQIETDQGISQIRVSDEFVFPVPEKFGALGEGPYRLGLRAHNLRTSRESERDVCFTGTVELAEVVGSDTEMHLKHDAQNLILLTPELKRVALGETLDVFLNPDDCFLFRADSGIRIAAQPAGTR